MAAVSGERILLLDKEAAFGGLDVVRTTVVDCLGMTLIPGFIDAHIHFIAYAAGLVSVDCGPQAVETIDDILRSLVDRAVYPRHGNWVRGAGYDEFSLRDGRHPTAKVIDRAVPDHPVRLDHRSGHASVLNSLTMNRVGITASTPKNELRERSADYRQALAATGHIGPLTSRFVARYSWLTPPSLKDDIGELRWLIIGVLGGGLLILYVVLVNIVRNGWITINRQRTQLIDQIQEIVATTDQLKEEIRERTEIERERLAAEELLDVS